MNGTMVVCLACRMVVWAYDADMGDVRGILNMMKIPCRLCGVKDNFDGWRVDDETIFGYLDCPDAWSAMRLIAEKEDFGWEASNDNTWDFP